MARIATKRATRATRARSAEGARGAAGPVRYGPLEEWVGFHLRLAQTASFAAFAREANGLAIRPGRFALLTLIGENPGIGQTALSRANGRDKSTLTPALNDLEKRGLIARKRVRDDRRSYALRLTEAGERALRELAQRAAEHEANLDRIIGRDRARFVKILKKIASELPNGTDEEAR